MHEKFLVLCQIQPALFYRITANLYKFLTFHIFLVTDEIQTEEAVSIPAEMKNSTASSTKTEEKSESKESDWTNVEKSESDDWEADFSDDADELNNDAKNEPKVKIF